MSQQPLPPAAQKHLDAGRALLAARNFPAAQAELQQALQLAPDAQPVLAAMGTLAMQAQDWAAAERIFRRAVALNHEAFRQHLALAIFNQQRYQDALPLLEEIAGSPNMDLNCALAYAMSLERCGEEDRAIATMVSIYQALPTERMAELLASALLRLGRHGDLDDWLPRLLTAHPGNGILLSARSEHALLSGDYATGFELIAHRWATALEKPKAATLPCPVWDGVRFDGTLLVTAEQGLGDEILSSSMFEDLLRLQQDAVIDCERRLLPLFRRSFPGLRFTDRAGDELAMIAAGTPVVRKIEAIELGRFFRRDSHAMPTRAHWLVADAGQVAHWRGWLAMNFPGKRVIGVSWRSYRHLLGDSKSIPVADLAPLLARDDSVCISLQYGDIREDLAMLQQLNIPAPVIAPGLDATQDIDGLCALIAALDSVVTSSNTTAHLAGGQGIPTYVLVPGGRYVLWYWGHDGRQTPWYPSLQIFRGPPRKDWRNLVAEVADLACARPEAEQSR